MAKKSFISKNKSKILMGVVYGFAVIGVLSTFLFLANGIRNFLTPEDVEMVVSDAPEITDDLLTVNEYSRPGIEVSKINGIVVHYTANPNTGAKQNRDYFEGLATSQITKASSHYIIGLDGEIIRCVPDNEMAYASNDRNSDTISIECCHFDETGEFYQQTYNSLVHLAAYLMGQYDLTADDVIRHYDVSGKNCPKYYVDHPEEWENFKKDLAAYIEKNGKRKE